jgi:hypothetical protein
LMWRYQPQRELDLLGGQLGFGAKALSQLFHLPPRYKRFQSILTIVLPPPHSKQVFPSFFPETFQPLLIKSKMRRRYCDIAKPRHLGRRHKNQEFHHGPSRCRYRRTSQRR